MKTFSSNLDPAIVSGLRAGLNGTVITPDDAGYDRARTVFYSIDRRPALIARVVNTADVSRVIAVARETGLELAVRSGGHSLAGHSTSDGGIVLDLSGMKKLEIDPQQRTAWAEAGLTTGEYTNATAIYGLATGFGDAGSVGVGGITLGGGVGYLVRKHGLTIDSLLAADVVTADGQLLRADAQSHPDLFWAIRGGGGNFGVVTRFQFQLHEVDTIVGGMLMIPATPDTIASFIAEAEAAPEELTTIANIMSAPPMPFVPAEHHGQLVIMALMAYAGEVQAGQKAIAPFRALATPIVDMLRPMPYPQIYPPEDPDYHPLGTVRTLFIDAVGRAVADTIVSYLQAPYEGTRQMAVVQLRVLGGAMARVPEEATAFAHRKRRIIVNVAVLYSDREEADVHDTWVTNFASVLRQGQPGAYVNFMGGGSAQQVREAYPDATWHRLRAIKARYDPTNFFHLNHNIPPASRQDAEADQVPGERPTEHVSR